MFHIQQFAAFDWSLAPRAATELPNAPAPRSLRASKSDKHVPAFMHCP